jgi:hypothetical protein
MENVQAKRPGWEILASKIVDLYGRKEATLYRFGTADDVSRSGPGSVAV